MSNSNKEYKRGPTAYNLYYSSAVKELKDNGTKIPSNMTRLIANKWKELSDEKKNEYKSLSKNIKEKIDQETKSLTEKNKKLGEYYQAYHNFLLKLIEKLEFNATSLVMTGFYLNKISEMKDTVGNELAYLLTCFSLSIKIAEDNSFSKLYTVLSKVKSDNTITVKKLLNCEMTILKHLNFDILPKDSPIWDLDWIISKLRMSEDKKRRFRYWVYKISIVHFDKPIRKEIIWFASVLLSRRGSCLNSNSLLLKLIF